MKLLIGRRLDYPSEGVRPDAVKNRLLLDDPVGVDPRIGHRM
ncbi:hypothetical protein [Azospirillum endophyticum]|nr:hypothetical protein [Azospirillum endophyticum]